jgi:hypothetical protein
MSDNRRGIVCLNQKDLLSIPLHLFIFLSFSSIASLPIEPDPPDDVSSHHLLSILSHPKWKNNLISRS